MRCHAGDPLEGERQVTERPILWRAKEMPKQASATVFTRIAMTMVYAFA